jgi:translation initiation factor 2 alpha subunit (eIF-2alpha)
MSTQEQARALMMRHHHLVKNRQQSLLNRAAAEMGVDTVETCNKIQGKLDPTFSHLYDRSSATMS